ncbi:MAG: metal-dependent hydrolase [Myxococcota bacterium]|nr:metal-dependent hydrolase [Myxococcota bacterium]
MSDFRQDSRVETAIRPRPMRLEFPHDTEALGIPGQPQDRHGLTGASPILLYLEPYLIQVMKRAKPSSAGLALPKHMEAFKPQEAYHFKQQARSNQMLAEIGYEGVRELARHTKGEHTGLLDKKTLRFNVAYGDGFDAFTAVVITG